MCSQHSRDPKSVTQQASKDRAREPSQVLQSPGARVRNKYLCFIPSVPMNKKRLLFPLSSALRRQISASWWSRRPSSTNRNFKNRALLIAAVPFLPPPSFPSGFESRFTFLSRLLFLYAMPSKHPLPDFVGHLVANGRFPPSGASRCWLIREGLSRCRYHVTQAYRRTLCRQMYT